MLGRFFVCRWTLVLCTVTVLGGTRWSHAGTIHVDVNATDPLRNGTTWCKAFATLSTAIDVAGVGDTIRVANGRYTPDPTGLADPREATFQLQRGVTIEGGYAGCGAENPNARNTSEYEVILSGDLAGDDGTAGELTGSDCCSVHPGTGCSDASCQQIVCAAFDQCCAIEWTNECVTFAGVYCCGLCDVATDCDNTYHVVTGIDVDRTAVLDGLTITAGNATDYAWPIDYEHTLGGGLYIDEGGGPTVRNCIFRANRGVTSAGVYVDCGTLENNAIFVGCSFLHNEGVAVQLFGCWTAHFENCIFVGNSGSGMVNSISNPTLVNCLFIGNHSTSFAGAIANFETSFPVLINCTIVGNRSDYSFVGGVSDGFLCSTTLTNCIVWGNTDDQPETDTETEQLWLGDPDLVTFTNWQGHGNGNGPGNIDSDPLFVDLAGPDGVPGTTDDNLRLLAESPSIDTGSNEIVAFATDLDGRPRILNSIVDMGAYESPNPIPTVGELGLIVFAMLLLVIGVIMVRGRQVEGAPFQNHN